MFHGLLLPGFSGPIPARLGRFGLRLSQFFENRAWHKGCVGSGVVKNANQ